MEIEWIDKCDLKTIRCMKSLQGDSPLWTNLIILLANAETLAMALEFAVILASTLALALFHSLSLVELREGELQKVKSLSKICASAPKPS